MRTIGVAAMMAMAAGSAWAHRNPVESKKLTICMESTGSHVAMQNEGRRIAARIFAAIGVEIQWRDLRGCPSNAIQISFSGRIPAGFRADALAYAMPYDGIHIVLLLDRVKDSVAPGAAGYLLGYTIAHEVTHVLEGIARHSTSGIMKAHWDLADHRQIVNGSLGSAPEDVELIYRGLDGRQSRWSASTLLARAE